MDLKQFHHFALVVADVDASVRWYDDVLGFALERRFGFAEVGVEIAHVVSPAGLRIELIQQAGSARSADRGEDALARSARRAPSTCLLVDDVEAAPDESRGKGVEVVHEVVAVEPAGVRNFWVRDNSGNLIEFNQWLAQPRFEESGGRLCIIRDFCAPFSRWTLAPACFSRCASLTGAGRL